MTGDGRAERVRLRPFEERDLDAMRRLDVDPGASEPFEWTGYHNPHARRQQWEQDGFLGTDRGMLAVTIDDDALVGLVNWRAFPPSWPIGACFEIGVLLFPEFRGQGIGTDAQRLLVAHLFATTLVHRIQAVTDTENVAEQRVLVKLGFEREGVLRGLVFRGGTWRDSILYALVRRD